MNFRGWGVLWLGIPIHNTRYLERTFTLKEDNTKLRCDIHFLGLGCVHEYILLAVRNEPHLCARDVDMDIAEKRNNPTSHPFPSDLSSFISIRKLKILSSIHRG